VRRFFLDANVIFTAAHNPNGNGRALFRLAADLIAGAARRILATQAQVVLALPGGRSAADVFDELAKAELPWAKIHVFMADERFVPLDHPDSNFRLLREHLVAPLALAGKIDPGNAHPFVFDPAT
jgi:6-phosphogluconolactonase